MLGDNVHVKQRLSTRDWFVSHVSMTVLATSLMSLGAVAIGWLPPIYNLAAHPALEALRATSAGQVLGRTAVIVGGALLVHTWLVLGITILRDNTVSTGQLYRLLSMSLAPLLIAPPLFSRDVYSYIAQGRLVILGLNPYDNGVGSVPGWFGLGADPMWAESPTPYGPFFIMLQAGIASLTPQSPTTAVILYKLVCLVGLALMATGVTRLATFHGISASAALWLAVLNPLVIVHLFMGLHNDGLMIGILLWSFVVALQRRPLWAIALLVLATGVKPIAAIALPFVVLASLPAHHSLKQRWFGWIAGSIGLLAGLSLLGWWNGLGFGWVGSLSTPGSVATLLSPTTAVAEIIGIVTRLFDVETYGLILGPLRLIGLTAAIALAALLALRPEGRPAVRSAAYALTAIVGLSPVVQPWYLLWALPFVAVVGLSRPWHLRTIVAGTAFFIIYSLSEVNVVTDSTIDGSDYFSIALSALIVIVIAIASPRERSLVLGTQYSSGLLPDADSLQTAQQMIVRKDVPHVAS